MAAIDSRTPVSRVHVSGDGPIGITQPNWTNKVYSSDEAADQLSVIDADTVSAIRTIDMGDPSGPHHLMASTNGHYIYVGEYHHNVVGVVDTRLDENVFDLRASDVNGAHTHAVWIAPNGKDLYATNEGLVQSGPGTFSKIDVPSREIVWEQAVGNRPSEVLVDHDIAYVSVRVDNVVRVYDIGGDNPSWWAPQKRTSTRHVVADQRRQDDRRAPRTPARMAFIDTRRWPRSTCTGHDNRPSVAVPGRRRHLHRARRHAGKVAVVDNRSRSLVTTYNYPNGRTRPHGVFYEPQK